MKTRDILTGCAALLLAICALQAPVTSVAHAYSDYRRIQCYPAELDALGCNSMPRVAQRTVSVEIYRQVRALCARCGYMYGNDYQFCCNCDHVIFRDCLERLEFNLR